jgi:hypothetical protein
MRATPIALHGHDFAEFLTGRRLRTTQNIIGIMPMERMF